MVSVTKLRKADIGDDELRNAAHDVDIKFPAANELPIDYDARLLNEVNKLSCACQGSRQRLGTTLLHQAQST